MDENFEIIENNKKGMTILLYFLVKNCFELSLKRYKICWIYIKQFTQINKV